VFKRLIFEFSLGRIAPFETPVSGRQRLSGWWLPCAWHAGL